MNRNRFTWCFRALSRLFLWNPHTRGHLSRVPYLTPVGRGVILKTQEAVLMCIDLWASWKIQEYFLIGKPRTKPKIVETRELSSSMAAAFWLPCFLQKVLAFGLPTVIRVNYCFPHRCSSLQKEPGLWSLCTGWMERGLNIPWEVRQILAEGQMDFPGPCSEMWRDPLGFSQ